MISINYVCKFYNNVAVLNNASCVLEASKNICILGRSGSGKSTLLRMIVGLESIDKGFIEVFDKKVCSENIKHIRNNIGFVFQNFNLFSHMKVIDNITYVPIKIQNKNPSEVILHAESLLDSFGVINCRDKYPKQLSGGQKQRVAILRAVITGVHIILMDEPTSALDPETIGDFIDMINNLYGLGISIIMVTHDINVARVLSDRVMMISKGYVTDYIDSDLFFSSSLNRSEEANNFVNAFLKYI